MNYPLTDGDVLPKILGEHPQFKPHFTPRQMLELGIFGGIAFSTTARRKGVPNELFGDLSIQYWNNPTGYDSAHNYFEVVPPLIPNTVPNNLRKDGGWFQWYVRFMYGRKSTEDNYFVDHWLLSVKNLLKYFNDGNRSDLGYAPQIRQALLELSFDSTKLFTWVPAGVV